MVTLVEVRRLPFQFEKEYKLIKKVDYYDDRVPCAFVRIPTGKKWHTSFWFDQGDGWLEPGCLVNLRSLNIEKAIVSLVETENIRKSGFQGRDWQRKKSIGSYFETVVKKLILVPLLPISVPRLQLSCR